MLQDLLSWHVKWYIVYHTCDEGLKRELGIKIQLLEVERGTSSRGSIREVDKYTAFIILVWLFVDADSHNVLW